MSPARIWLRDSPQARIPTRLPYGARPVSPCSAGRNDWPLVTTPAAMRASRCGVVAGHLRAQALAGECPSRWFPHGLLAVDAHGRTLPHAGSAQSAPRSLRGRCRQRLVDSRIELAGELRLPLHQDPQRCRSTDTTENPPDASAYGISYPPSPRRARKCGERTGCGTLRAAMPQIGTEFDLC